METVTGTVSKILFSNEATGFKVIRLKTRTGSPTIITGEMGPDIILDTVATFHGDFKSHPKYGISFRVTSYEITYDAEALNSIKIFIDNIAPNIGPERATAIVEYFGDKTIDVLDHEPQKLIEVDGIGEISAQSLMKAWEENRERWNAEREIYSLRAFLSSLGLKEKRIKKILSVFGGGMSAEEKIRENPYMLMDIEGFGFSTTDFIAKRLGVTDDNPHRLRAFIIYLLNEICTYNGHLFLYQNEIPDMVNKYSSENATSFLGKPTLDQADIDNVLRSLQDEHLLVVEDNCVYHQKNHLYESRSAQLLANIIDHKSELIFLNTATVDDHIKKFEEENSIVLSPEQRDAMHFFAEKKVFVITGAPGTGKTLITKAIVQIALQLRLDLTCMTPTGISAKKLAQTVQYDAYTIHRRLGFRGNEWAFNESNLFETDLVIIDEISMLDQEVMYRLLSALRSRTHIIFVGDQYQLPSVGAGNVLQELIASGEIPVVRLEKIFRQNEASDIIKAAHKIKNGDTDLSLFKHDPQADVFFMRMKDPPEIEKVVVSLAQKFKDERRLFQIITPRNDGPLSVNLLNGVLQNVLNPYSPSLPEIKLRDMTIRKGDRVIVRKNDYDNDIYNGDIGKVIDISAGQIIINIDDRLIPLSLDEVEEKIKLAYTISVHKSQGLEYPYVILPFINQFGKMLLQRNLLYTAITRAKKKVLILGHGSALERAINNASVARRNTNLSKRIQECLHLKRNSSSLPSPGLQPNCQNVTESRELSSSETEEEFSPTPATGE